MNRSGMLAAGRRQLERDLAGSPRRAWTSPVTLGLDSALRRALADSTTGVLLDAGCGTMPYRSFVTKYASRYIGFDMERRADGVHLVGDVQQMTAVRDASVNTVLCSEVLEHVVGPPRALAEFHRVLTPGGRLVLSTPFLARLHEEPHDYWRFTRFGLERLLGEAGFQLRSVEATGGLFAFLGHQPAILILSLAWPVPLLRHIAWLLVAALVTLPCRLLDLATRNRAKFPSGYVSVAEKR